MKLLPIIHIRRTLTVGAFYYRAYGKFSTVHDGDFYKSDDSGVLAKHTHVQLQVHTLHPQIRKQFFPHVREDTIVLSSDIVKKIVRDTGSLVCLVDGHGDIPVFSLSSKSMQDESHRRIPDKLGIKLTEGERGKTIRLGVNIDDHMLSIRVKQAESFIRSGYIVTVVVKLPKNFTAAGQSDEEKQRLSKLAYDVETRRFHTVFSNVPGASLRVIERPQPTEIVFLLRPSQSE